MTALPALLTTIHDQAGTGAPVTVDGHPHAPLAAVTEIAAEMGLRIQATTARPWGEYAPCPHAADVDRHVRLRQALRVLAAAGVPAADLAALEQALGLPAQNPLISAAVAAVDARNTHRQGAPA